MAEKDFGGLGRGGVPGGRDLGMEESGPDEDPTPVSRKGSDMAGATTPENPSDGGLELREPDEEESDDDAGASPV